MDKSNGAGGNLQLKRVLTLKYLIAFGLAYLAPTVVFNYYGIITELTGGMMALAYMITTVALFFTAFSYTKMVQAFPVAGSAYTYVQRAVNPYLGFFTGWIMLLDYLLLPMVCYLLFGIYMNEFLPVVPITVWVVGAAVMGALINIVGVKTAGRVNTVIIAAQILFSFAFIIIIIRYVSMGGGSGSLFVSEAIFNAETFERSSLMWGASILAVSFLGFDAVSTLAEETKDPEKTISKAILIIAVGAGLLFSVIAYFSQIAWPNAYSEIDNVDTGIFELLYTLGGDTLSTIFLITDNLATFICAMAGLAAVSRILYGMGRDGILPKKFFGKLSPKFQTPVNNIILTSIIALSALFYSDNLMGAASLVSFGALTGFALVNYSVINHYFIRGNRRQGADLFNYLIMPGIGVIICVILWLSIESVAKILGGVWILIGIIYIITYALILKKDLKDFKLEE